MRRAFIAAAVLGGAALFLVAPATGRAQTNGEKVHIEAWAVNMSNIATGAIEGVEGK